MPNSTGMDILIVAYSHSEMLYNNENECFMTTCNKVMTLIMCERSQMPKSIYCIIPVI